ncbi:uncharacterized protein LOC115402859 isoform X2 [Salarias fasciatus]|uniref:uncharacterized protein LOC115402859 isoform X2 n=1 Tax=Salarias fasciatus TaxID=181472 RepID=UPI001176B7F6|nr:uncharacterized protein LOC115402859 isoform X2 [Salarias fasciatus]
MERLKSEQSRLRAWLSEDPDHIVDQCGDILSMNQCKEVQKQTSASEKIRVLLEIIINKGEGTCQSFIDILELNRDHYRDLQQFFSSAQGSFTPTVVSDRGSLVSINEVKDTKGKSYSNKMEVVHTPGALSGPVDGRVPQATFVATGSSGILADRLCGVTVDGEIIFSASVKPPEACTVREEQALPQGPAVRRITEHRVELMDCLRADPIILQHVHAKGLISYVQYQDLKHMTKPSQAVTELLDVLIGKGQETCAQFLQLLEEPDCLDTYPQLKNILDMK